MTRATWIGVLYALVLALLLLSAIGPFDRATWWMEVAPVFIGFPLLWLSRRRFPLTTVLYVLIAVHAVILLVGGHWTYARVPIGFSVQEWLGLGRNPYDKLGHFAQGFVPAIIARELLLRHRVISRGAWLSFVVVCIVLAVSATYELVEWGAALALGQGAEEFLGTQGDIWDTQSDMFMALVGAAVALLTLRGLHDRQLSTLPDPVPTTL